MKMLLMRFFSLLFFFPFFVLKIEELKNENALLRAQLQQHGIEMVGETPPQWRNNETNWERSHHSDMQPKWQKRRQDDGKKKQKQKTDGLVKNHFLFFDVGILLWVSRWRTLQQPIAAVLDCSNPIEKTTHYSSVEMCFKKRCPPIRVLLLAPPLRRSSELLLCFLFM